MIPTKPAYETILTQDRLTQNRMAFFEMELQGFYAGGFSTTKWVSLVLLEMMGKRKISETTCAGSAELSTR